MRRTATESGKGSIIPTEAAWMLAIGCDVGIDGRGHRYEAGPGMDVDARVALGVRIVERMVAKRKYELAANLWDTLAKRWPGRFAPRDAAFAEMTAKTEVPNG
ncbi:MAG: hypothetical protein AB9869_37290 [Verrucomicrobiia bacterium]